MVLWISPHSSHLPKTERGMARGRREKFDLTVRFFTASFFFSSCTFFSIIDDARPVAYPGGFLGIILFIKWETKTSSPVLEIELFRDNRTFAFTNLATAHSFQSSFAMTFLLSLYLQYVKKLTPESAGLILIAQPIVQALCSPYSGSFRTD